jgi:hypothetical protein
MPTTADLLAELEAARKERDDALTRLANARAELDALKQAIKNKDEPEVPLYPDSAGLGPETPLRYIAADAVNDALKRFTSPIQKALRQRFGDRDGR